jgi:hypothetical protein
MFVDDTVKVVAVAAVCANDRGPRATAIAKSPSNHARVFSAAPEARRGGMYFFVSPIPDMRILILQFLFLRKFES